jgi:hypothetical protein
VHLNQPVLQGEKLDILSLPDPALDILEDLLQIVPEPVQRLINT